MNFTVGAGGGDGAWLASPSTIPWNFTTNSGTFPVQAVTVSTTSGLSSYNVNTTQTSSYHWLLVSANGQPANSVAAGSIAGGFSIHAVGR